MELTTTQIKEVEKYLQIKNFDFTDLKVEILDHIISDIESLMFKNYDFENALKMTLLKWDKYFKETSSFFFGMMYSESKIVVEKAVKMFKPFYFIYLAAYILPAAFLKLVPLQFDKSFVNFINGFLLTIAVSAIIYVLFMMIKTKVTKVKTTYRFILKTQYFGLILLIMGIAVGVFNENGEMNPVFTGFVCGGFAVVFICHHFYKKHKEVVQQYKIS
jgi:hypothetical protein